jgi:predicted N-formylglutamate amidohydrolase
LSLSDSADSSAGSPADSQAVERFAAADPRCRWFLSCEHASNALPLGRAWPKKDRWLCDSHWAFDPGAAELSRELSAALGAGAVLAGFSRLWIDPNRPLQSDTLIRREAEGRSIALNAYADNRRERLLYWHAYHNALDKDLGQSQADVLLALHSFTKRYEGSSRDFDVGVLFDREQRLAEALAAKLQAAGIAVRLNEPYSGKQGMIYAASRHAAKHGCRAVELEVRNDLCSDSRFRRLLIDAFGGFDLEATLG